MARTFIWRVPRVDSTPLLDGIAIISNDSDPGEIEIVEIRLTEPSEMAATLAGSGSQDLVRITAATGGDTVAALKMDTGSADLPSQVEFRTSPAVTETNLLRRTPDCPQFSVASANAVLAAKASFKPIMRTDVSVADQIWNSWSAPSGSEGIIIRAGEGISFVQRSGIVPHAMTINMRVRNVSTGATYTFRSRDIGTMVGGRALWSLMNGTGSGVTLEVTSIQLAEDGDVSGPLGPGLVSPATIRLIRCEGVLPLADFSPGVSAPVSMDPGPSNSIGVSLRSGAFQAKLVGTDEGAVYTWNTTDSSVTNVAREQRAGIVRQIVRCPRPNRVGDAVATPDQGFDVFKARAGAGIVLRRGQSLAIAGGRAGTIDNSQFNYFDLRITFVHRPANNYSPVGNNRIVRAS